MKEITREKAKQKWPIPGPEKPERTTIPSSTVRTVRNTSAPEQSKPQSIQSSGHESHAQWLAYWESSEERAVCVQIVNELSGEWDAGSSDLVEFAEGMLAAARSGRLAARAFWKRWEDRYYFAISERFPDIGQLEGQELQAAGLEVFKEDLA